MRNILSKLICLVHINCWTIGKATGIPYKLPSEPPRVGQFAIASPFSEKVIMADLGIIPESTSVQHTPEVLDHTRATVHDTDAIQMTAYAADHTSTMRASTPAARDTGAMPAPAVPAVDRCFSGPVQVGTGEATVLGFPTMNLHVPYWATFETQGTYAAIVESNDTQYQAAVYCNASRVAVSRRADYSNDGTQDQIIEVHVLLDRIHDLRLPAQIFTDMQSRDIKVRLLKHVYEHQTFDDVQSSPTTETASHNPVGALNARMPVDTQERMKHTIREALAAVNRYFDTYPTLSTLQHTTRASTSSTSEQGTSCC